MKLALAIVTFAIALVPRLAAADGIVIKPYEDGWRPAAENLQRAQITFREGIERLTVAIEVDGSDAKTMVWLLPVPALPKQVHVDVLASFPPVRGTEVYGGSLEHFETMRTAAVVMQVWPPLAAIVVALGGSAMDALFGGRDHRQMEAAKAEAPAPAPEPLVVHEHVEKQGVVSEVIAAREGSALYAYLEGKGLNLKAGAVPTLDFYIGKDYTFVATWFDAGTERSNGRDSNLSRAVEIRFPTKEMFFPLFPTSAYGERVVPASIRVAGHVTPRPFADIVQQTSIGYYASTIRGNESPGALGTDLYTKIDIDAPAKAFTQDLWISPKPPDQRGLGLATFIVLHPAIVYIGLLVMVSALVSLLVGWPIYRELRTAKGASRLMLVGLGNCVTLLGMLATVRTLPKGWKRRVGYLAAFSLLFMLGAAIVTWQAEAAFEPMRPKPPEFRTSSSPVAPKAPVSADIEERMRMDRSKDAEALYQQALAMESSGKAVESIRIYRRAARAGNGKAARHLGEIFEKGIPGVTRDNAESLQWYEIAHQLGQNVEPAAAR